MALPSKTLRRVMIDKTEELKDMALIMAVNCVRNTILEEYHSRGSLSQEDMKILNKEVSNKLYTFLRYFYLEKSEKKEVFMELVGMAFPDNWDRPVIDKDMQDAVNHVWIARNKSK